MQENDIGQDFALFYMAYAAFMELRGNFGKAEAIFQKGLERCTPLLHLLSLQHFTANQVLTLTELKRMPAEGTGLIIGKLQACNKVLGLMA